MEIKSLLDQRGVKIALSAIMAILIVVVICGVLINIARALLCSTEVYKEVRSPDGQYKVTVFSGNCGATTGFTTNVSILPANANIKNGRANIMQMDGYPRETGIEIVWQNDRTISISYYDDDNIIFQRDAYQNILNQFTIQYTQVSAP